MASVAPNLLSRLQIILTETPFSFQVFLLERYLENAPPLVDINPVKEGRVYLAFCEKNGYKDVFPLGNFQLWIINSIDVIYQLKEVDLL